MNSFSLRTATAEDERHVGDVLAASYSALLATHYTSALLAAVLPAITQANPKLLACGTYYVAEAGQGRIVGCGGWTRERPGSGAVAEGLGHIRHFATHPDWTGRGVGKALLAHAIRQAEIAAVSVLECYATLNAEGFYRANGFARLGLLDVPVLPDTRLPSVHMLRRPARPPTGRAKDALHPHRPFFPPGTPQRD